MRKMMLVYLLTFPVTSFVTFADVSETVAKSRSSTTALHIRRPDPNAAYVYVYSGPGTADRPLFEMLLPEYIHNDGREILAAEKRPVHSYYHMQPTDWEDLGNGRWRMTQTHPGYLTYQIELSTTVDALYLNFRIRNETSEPWRNLSVNFCSGSGWGDFQPPNNWFNPDFQPAPPPPVSRDPQKAAREIYLGMVSRWQDQVLPQHVWVHTDGGWKRYQEDGHRVDLPLIVCRSLDGQKLLAQAWNRKSPVSHGPHLCIHLAPVIANKVEPGEWVTARGATYLMDGSLQNVLDRYQSDFGDSASD
ncbi:MAG: hypothetical protein MK110_07350 [Fuerstiella sp.]|nr:hypothetical protein [Fuerstiella sp.]